jgi:hypothetical protein
MATRAVKPDDMQVTLVIAAHVGRPLWGSAKDRSGSVMPIASRALPEMFVALRRRAPAGHNQPMD